MDRKKISHLKTRRPAARVPKGKKAVARPWRQFVPYVFMGVVFTLGFLALFSVIHGKLALSGRIILAAMVVASVEYYFRRIMSGPSSMEHEFSALSDFFCFAIVPGLLMYWLAFRGWGILGLIGLFVIIFGALIRLSLYKLFNPIIATRGFIGMPVAITAAFIALIAQLLVPEQITYAYRLVLLGLVTGLMFLTVSTIRYPDPAEKPVVFILAAMMVLAIFIKGPVAIWSARLLLCGGAAYIIIAPLGARRGGRDHDRNG